MALISSNFICITASHSPLLSPFVSSLNSYNAHVKSNRNSEAGTCRSRSRSVIQAAKTESLVPLDNPLSTSGNSALEQLDIERGVCVPFRKYTPELVCDYIYQLIVAFYLILLCAFLLQSSECYIVTVSFTEF